VEDVESDDDDDLKYIDLMPYNKLKEVQVYLPVGEGLATVVQYLTC